ncbi:peptidoglycan recognition protein family protein [Paracoccus sp. T5]
MPPRFVGMSRADFISVVGEFAWKNPKTSVHVHHTWRPNHSQYRGQKTILAMWKYHTQTNGWSDIAQHVSIAPDGTIWSGRNWNAVPASAAGYNTGAFMFETIGDFDKGKDVLQGEQLQSVLTVTATILIAFGLKPWTAVKFHNQMSQKTCPGSSIDRTSFINAVIAKQNELESGIGAFLSPLSRSDGAREALSVLSAAPETDAPDDADASHNAPEDLFNAADGDLDALHVEEPRAAPLAIVAEVQSLAEREVSEDELFAELAFRAQSIGKPDGALEPLSLSEQLTALGLRIFKRLHRELHTVLCGSAESDKYDRDKLRAAFGIGGDAVTAALVGIMTSSLAIAQPVAVIVAAIIIRRLLTPTYLETCAWWGEQLNERVLA